MVREYGDGLLQIVEAVGCVDEQIAMTREGVRRLNIALNKLVSACKAVGIEPTFEELLEQKKAALQVGSSPPRVGCCVGSGFGGHQNQIIPPRIALTHPPPHPPTHARAPRRR